MKFWLKKKIPKHPSWRWILFNILNKKPIQLSEDWKNAFVSFLDENMEHLDELGLVELSKFLIERNDESVELALEIFFTEPMKKGVQAMLIENVSSEKIAETLNYKFNEAFTAESVDRFKFIFFDTDVVNTYELSLVMGKERPSPAPTSGKFRPQFAAYEQGGSVEVDMEDALLHMFTRSFFESEKMYKAGNANLAMRAQKMATEIYKALSTNQNKQHALNLATGTIPTSLDIKVVYPEYTAMDKVEFESGCAEDE